jgi:CubicO group peptidase (beta-lactamase class C family)
MAPTTDAATGWRRLVSTARDFARFGTMLLGDGALERVRIMKAETASGLARTCYQPGRLPSGGRIRCRSTGRAPRW